MLYFDIFLDDSGALTRFRFAYAMEQNWNQKVFMFKILFANLILNFTRFNPFKFKIYLTNALINKLKSVNPQALRKFIRFLFW